MCVNNQISVLVIIVICAHTICNINDTAIYCVVSVGGWTRYTRNMENLGQATFEVQGKWEVFTLCVLVLSFCIADFDWA